jgi:hypothetical protein
VLRAHHHGTDNDRCRHDDDRERNDDFVVGDHHDAPAGHPEHVRRHPDDDHLDSWGHHHDLDGAEWHGYHVHVYADHIDIYADSFYESKCDAAHAIVVAITEHYRTRATTD